MKKQFIQPTAEVISFLVQEKLMNGYVNGYLYELEGDIGGLVPGESGAGGGSGWGDF